MNCGKKKIFVSFSGGADSLTLLLLTLQDHPDATAVHFEHGLRGEDSLRDADFCRAFCEKYGVKFLLIPLDVPANKLPGESDESAARRLRLEAWKKLLAPDEADAIVLTGHHGDDAAETLLMRLCRGSNSSGLAGLRAEKVVETITFQRPLLHWTRREIEEFLHRQGITQWCHDATNDENIYTRNFFRNCILPQIAEKLPYAPGGIRRTLRNLEDDADFLEQAAADAFLRCKDGAIDHWRELHPALLVRVLRLFLGGLIPDHNLTDRFAQMLHSEKDPEPRYLLLPDHSRIVFRGDRIFVEAEQEIAESPVLWDWKNTPQIRFGGQLLIAEYVEEMTTQPERNECFFDAGTLPRILLVNSWQEGDTIRSFDGHRKNLKKLFCDLHLNGTDRKKIPVLRTESGEIIFVPGVRTGAHYTVTGSTQKILRIRKIQED